MSGLPSSQALSRYGHPKDKSISNYQIYSWWLSNFQRTGLSGKASLSNLHITCFSKRKYHRATHLPLTNRFGTNWGRSQRWKTDAQLRSMHLAYHLQDWGQLNGEDQDAHERWQAYGCGVGKPALVLPEANTADASGTPGLGPFWPAWFPLHMKWAALSGLSLPRNDSPASRVLAEPAAPAPGSFPLPWIQLSAFQNIGSQCPKGSQWEVEDSL